MHQYFKIAFLMLCFFACKNNANDYYSKLAENRREIDEIFSNESTTPLNDEELKTFEGLSYYDVDKNYLIAARLEKFDTAQLVEINHTLNRKYPFIRWGRVHFKLNNDSCHLTVFLTADTAQQGNSMAFVPFKDATNDAETYEGGRYLDIELKGAKTEIDFNYAYNPNCAYSYKWSCPLVPEENVLSQAVKAGVKKPSFGH